VFLQGLRSGLQKEVVEVSGNKRRRGRPRKGGEVEVWRKKNTGLPKKHGKLQCNRTLEKILIRDLLMIAYGDVEVEADERVGGPADAVDQ
jgi:hypothetical protein